MIFGLGMALAAVPFLNWVTPAATTVGAATVEFAADLVELRLAPIEGGAR